MTAFKISHADEFGRRPGHRPQRVADAIQRRLAVLFLAEVKDPRLHGLVVTGVEMSRDLRRAKIYYGCSVADAPAIARALERATGFLRSLLARELGLRYTPQLVFFRDESLDRQEAIERLLHGEGGDG